MNRQERYPPAGLHAVQVFGRWGRCALIVLLLMPLAAVARDLPLAWTLREAQELDALETVYFEGLDLDRLAAEDEFNELVGRPPRFAVARQTAITPLTAGNWTETADGISIWRYRVRAEAAVSLNFGFRNVFLPEGARLYFYSVAAAQRGEDDRYELIGPSGAEINEAHREFWTPILSFDDVIIELDVPTRVRHLVSL